MMTDKDLTDDVLDEIIAGAKTSMEQYLALSLKAERAANRQQSAQQNIPENIPTLREAVDTIRSSGIAIDAEEILAERDALNTPVIPDGWVACSERMPGEVLTALQNVARLRRNLNDFCGDKSVIAKCLSEAEGALLNAVNRHSTMLAEPLKEAKNV